MVSGRFCVSTGGTSAGVTVQLQGVVVDAVSSLGLVRELLDAGVPVVHPAHLTLLQPSHQISHEQPARSTGRRTLRRENRTSDTIRLSKLRVRQREKALRTSTTSVMSAPAPVQYSGKRRSGSRRRKHTAATHSMKLCHTPTHQIAQTHRYLRQTNQHSIK